MKAVKLSLYVVATLLSLAMLFGCGKKAEEGGGESATTTQTAKAPDQPTGPVGAVSGTVTYQGEVPQLQILKMDADPACAAKHTEPVRSQALVLGPNNALANVFVKVKSGLPERTWPAPSEPVVLDQNGCIYEPHVFAVMVGQPLKILNSDGILHNIHPLPKVNRGFNFAMPKTVKEATRTFSKAEEEPFPIKCDVHPWMQAWMAVMPHPFYAVSGEDGKYTIQNLPPGTYEIEAWHERLGTQTTTVTVAANETATADFTFTRE